MAKKNAERPIKVVADNRKARFNYELQDSVEAGLVLFGTEVKALRAGRSQITESYAQVKDGEVFLINAHIEEFSHGNRFNHTPRRPRKLLLHARQIARFAQGVEREGMTIVPLKLYFDERGRAKIQLALGRGKKLHDKRAAIKDRDWNRQKARVMRSQGKE